jgi:uncharacterized protein (TIGR00297 family)
MQLLFALFFIIALATALTQWLAVRFPTRTPDLRKGLHIIAILCCAVGTEHFPNAQWLGYLFLAFSVVLFGVVYSRLLNISAGRSWGIALFPLAFGMLLLCSMIERTHVVTAMLVLALSDALAGWVGSRYARAYWSPLFEQKSILGSVVFGLSAMLILLWRYGYSIEICLVMLLLAALSACVEMFSWRGSDNFWIPVVLALCLQHWSNGGLQWEVAYATLLAAVLLLPLLRQRRWLSAEGSVAAGFMGILLTGLLGPLALVFPVVFLALGSLTAKLNPMDKEPDGRNAIQVFANGGMGLLAALLVPVLPKEAVLVCLVVIFATANADTLSSEIGKYFGHRTFDILRWNTMQSGLSGGVSAIGTLAGAVGAGIIACLGSWLYGFNSTTTVKIAILGFAGMLLDSVLGSLLQAKYSVDGQITEVGTSQQLISGVHHINNDGVNLISIAIIVLLTLSGWVV